MDTKLDESLGKYQREYLYDEYEIQQEIDRLQQQYEIYMEQAIWLFKNYRTMN